MLKIIKDYFICILLGVSVGMITLIGQKHLPINFNFLANSGAIWLIPAYAVSYKSKKDKIQSISLCVICLLCSVLGYYTFESICNHHSLEIDFFVLIWIVCAFIGGIIFGMGAYFANHNNNWLKFFSLNLLPAVFLAEGINKIIHISGYRHMIPAVIMVVVIGMALYFAINQKSSFKKYNLISILVITLLGLFGYELLHRITI